MLSDPKSFVGLHRGTVLPTPHLAHDADGKHQVGKDGGIGSIGTHQEAWKQDGHERGAIGRQRFV